MARLSALFGLAACMAGHAQADETLIQKCLCEGMQLEVTLKSGARADCVSETHAIEVDPTDKWAEALGQSLHYADELGLHPMIYLYCETGQGNCLKHSLRLESTIAAYDLPITVELFNERDVLDACIK